MVGVASPPSQVGVKIHQTVKRFIVKSVQDDYITCNEMFDDRIGEADVLIAKPYLLRKTPFDGTDDGRNGYTYAYSTVSGYEHTERTSTKTEDDSTEDQIVTPAYVVGDEIWAMCNPVGGTGVTDADGKQIVWLDQNYDGRQWAQGTLTEAE